MHREQKLGNPKSEGNFQFVFTWTGNLILRFFIFQEIWDPFIGLIPFEAIFLRLKGLGVKTCKKNVNLLLNVIFNLKGLLYLDF